MKKLFSAALSLFLVLCAAGCTGSGDAPASDYVTLGEYKGVGVTLKTSVSDEDVRERINEELEAAATTLMDVEQAASKGDTVRVSFTLTCRGKAVDEAAGTVYFEIGSGEYPFEDSLEGVMPGETVEFKTTLDKDYTSKEDIQWINGKAVVFSVTLEGVLLKIYPEYDRKFVLEKGYRTTELYEEAIRAELEEEFAGDVETRAAQAAMDTVMANCKFSPRLPEDMLERHRNDALEYHASVAKSYDMELDAFYTLYLNMDETAFDQYISDIAKTLLREELLINAIAEAEGITVSDEEYQSVIDRYMASFGFPDEAAFKAYYGIGFAEYYGEEVIRAEALSDKIYGFVVANAVVTLE